MLVTFSVLNMIVRFCVGRKITEVKLGAQKSRVAQKR
jgi:hypothetical protein